MATTVKTVGFDLLSKESIIFKGKNAAMERDSWLIRFFEAENQLLFGKF